MIIDIYCSKFIVNNDVFLKKPKTKNYKFLFSQNQLYYQLNFAVQAKTVIS